MTLVEALDKLPKHKIEYIHSVIAEASLASELKDYKRAKEIVRFNKNKSLGIVRKIFITLETLNAREFEGVKKALLNR